ncbi:hypothetical protein AMELA_G00222670 [Ameiurus melas]|uniref:Uncharacterized protein n=1 Tax=Ameiurus melas TaxID=219545 RepID=A0A7J6A0P1_AMEME|nr:hypothetical protein AMELA_G00222670 [Ameiurus melas]
MTQKYDSRWRRKVKSQQSTCKRYRRKNQSGGQMTIAPKEYFVLLLWKLRTLLIWKTRQS